jgi:hypothetical protein
MVHLSYLTLDTLRHRHLSTPSENRRHDAMVIEKISGYDPGSQIAVIMTDGKSERFLLGMRRPT